MRPRDLKRLCIALLASLAAFAGCDAASERTTFELAGAAMGTSFNIKLVDPPQAVDAQAIQRRIERTLARIERSMSTYMAESELSRFNGDPTTEWFEVSPELCNVVAAAQTISALSNGAFDITVGPLVNLWGFGPDGHIDAPPDPQRIADALRNTGHARLHADCTIPALRKDLPGLYVDLSAYAKGYAVDRVAGLLDDAGLHDYLVEIGGELFARGANASGDNWAIAIERPDRTSRAVEKILRLTDSALATSGDYRNYFEHGGDYFSHTIDPRSGYPVSHAAASVTVVADTAAFADGIATALLVLGPADGLALAERENIAAYFLLRVGSDIEERMSTLFADEVIGG